MEEVPVPHWETALSWLTMNGYTPNAADVAAFDDYFKYRPEQAEVENVDGRLPLHCAASHKQGEHAVTLVKSLLRIYAFGAHYRDIMGELPLHCAAFSLHENQHTAAIVELLLNAFREGVQHRSKRGGLPLHNAANSYNSEHGAAVVTLLLDAYPEGARQRTFNDGCLPLHIVAKSKSCKSAVAIATLLLEAHRDGVQQQNLYQFLPLHCAVETQTGEDGAAMVTLLLNAYPAGAKQKNMDGHLPADIAERLAWLPASCTAMLRAAANSNSTPPTRDVAHATGGESQAVTAPNTEAAAATVVVPTTLLPVATATSETTTATAVPTFPIFAAGHFANVSATSIGSGTHKTVYSATYTGPTTSTLKSGSDVALLYFKQEIAPSLHEYKAMIAIRAPHLARFYGSVTPSAGSDTQLCLVSDLAQHGSLLHFFERAEEDALDISLSHKLVMANQAGLGLSALHEHSLVHADVAARNVFVYVFDPNSHHRTQVKLSDYGMVRERSKYTYVSTGAATEAVPPGEPLPLSPKWASWESLNKDKFYDASDVWSFGVLTWEILTEGNEPYPDMPHSKSAMINHLAQGHRLTKPHNCSPALWSVMSQCWREKRKERPGLPDVLAQIALGLDEAAAAASAAQLTLVQRELHALQLAQEAWLKTGYGWRAGGIELSADLDRELTYIPRGTIVCADPRASTGPLATAVADAIDDLVMMRGGSKGGRFRANVDAITLCKNQQLIVRFNACLYLQHVQRQENQGTVRFNGRWDDSSVVSGLALQDKQAVFARLERLFADTDVGPGPGVKVTLMWHGVPSPEVADAVCRTGLSSRVSGNDQGYFGKGIYLTPEAEYAAFYANGQHPPEKGETYTLVLCAVCTANPYPLTRRTDYDSGAGISKFHFDYGVPAGTAKALYKGFDAHFVAIDTEELWQAASNVAHADYHELVVGSEDQVLPFAQVVVKIK